MYSKEIPSDTPDFEPLKVRATGRGISINDGFGAIYVKGAEIDAVAVALIQAGPLDTPSDHVALRDLARVAFDEIVTKSPEERIALGVALIRSAK